MRGLFFLSSLMWLVLAYRIAFHGYQPSGIVPAVAYLTAAYVTFSWALPGDD